MKSSPCFFCLQAEKVLQAKSAKSAESLFPFRIPRWRWRGRKLRYDKSLCNKVQFCFALSGNSLTFTTEFRRHSGGVRKDFTEKGVIEIIFDVQTSQL